MAKRGGFPGGMPGNMNNLMKQAQKMQEQMAKAQEELEEAEIVGESGNGLVKVTVNGKKVVSGIKLDASVVDPDDIEMLQDLVTAAVNEAIRNANTDKEETMNKISGGMNLGGMGGLF